jgi:hypothetical protein
MIHPYVGVFVTADNHRLYTKVVELKLNAVTTHNTSWNTNSPTAGRLACPIGGLVSEPLQIAKCSAS